MTDTRKILIVLATAVALLAGCEPEAGTETSPPRAPEAGGAKPPAQTGKAQPAPVQGDPSAHNTQQGVIELIVEWTSENSSTPACEWTRNGAVSPCTNIGKGKREGRDYLGTWVREEVALSGDTFTINAQGNIGIKAISCSVNWKGAYHEGVSNGKRCSITFKLN